MNPNDYDDDGNNIVPCPICLSAHCPSKEKGGKCPEEEEFIKTMTNIQSEGAEKEIITEAITITMPSGEKMGISMKDGKFEFFGDINKVDEGAKIFVENIAMFLNPICSQAFEEGRAEERKRVVGMMKKITTVHQPLNFQKKPVREGETTAYCGGCDRFVIEAGCLCGMVSIDDLLTALTK
jgi:hypothetical protein